MGDRDREFAEKFAKIGSDLRDIGKGAFAEVDKLQAERDSLKARMAELEIERDGFKAGSADNAMHFEALKEDYDSLRSLCKQMARNIERCRAQFDFYVTSHMGKRPPDMDKAATNQEFVEICEAAISAAKEQGIEP